MTRPIKKKMECMFCGKDYDRSREQSKWIIEWEFVCCPRHAKAFRTIWCFASKQAWNRIYGTMEGTLNIAKDMFKRYDDELKNGIKV